MAESSGNDSKATLAMKDSTGRRNVPRGSLSDLRDAVAFTRNPNYHTFQRDFPLRPPGRQFLVIDLEVRHFAQDFRTEAVARVLGENF